MYKEIHGMIFSCHISFHSIGKIRHALKIDKNNLEGRLNYMAIDFIYKSFKKVQQRLMGDELEEEGFISLKTKETLNRTSKGN